MKTFKTFILLSLLVLMVTSGCAAHSFHDKGRLVSLPPAPANSNSGQRIALLVGINDFKYDKDWHSLRYAKKDAETFSRILQDSQQGNFHHVFTLTTDRNATQQSLQQALQRIRNLNISKDDTVLIYFSTHGTLARDDKHRLKQYIVTHDTDPNNIPQTALKVDTFLSYFSELPSRRKVAIFAFCHSGSGKSGLTKHMMQELKNTKGSFFAPPLQQVSEASLILSACAWGETAREDDNLHHDIYTHYFMEALKHRIDLNRDGIVTSSEAHDYARKKTYDHTGGLQRPTAISDVMGLDPIRLTGSNHQSPKPILVSFDDELQNTEVLINGRNKGKLPGIIALNEKMQTVTLKQNGKILAQSIINGKSAKQFDATSLIEDYNSPKLQFGLQTGINSFVSSRKKILFPNLTNVAGIETWVSNLLPIPAGLSLQASYYGITESISEQDLNEKLLMINFDFNLRYQFFQRGAFTGNLKPGTGIFYWGRYIKKDLDEGEQGLPLKTRQHQFSFTMQMGLEILWQLNDMFSLSFASTARLITMQYQGLQDEEAEALFIGSFTNVIGIRWHQ